MTLRIGVDFDNTIICYDGVFHRAAIEKGLIPETVGRAKNQVRDHLRAQQREDDWTWLQGYVYGLKIIECPPFPGVLEFFARCAAAGLSTCIVSHKTRIPYKGPAYDLHSAARGWIQAVGLSDTGILADDIHFEQTKQGKLDRIAALHCTHFIDDLPEFLCEPGFPQQVERILFDPNSLHPDLPGITRVDSWTRIGELFANSVVR